MIKAFYLLFLLTFSYFMMCELKYEEILNLNSNFDNKNESHSKKIKTQISWVEYFIIYWVFSFFCSLIFQVIIIRLTII